MPTGQLLAAVCAEEIGCPFPIVPLADAITGGMALLIVLAISISRYHGVPRT